MAGQETPDSDGSDDPPGATTTVSIMKSSPLVLLKQGSVARQCVSSLSGSYLPRGERRIMATALPALRLACGLPVHTLAQGDGVELGVGGLFLIQVGRQKPDDVV